MSLRMICGLHQVVRKEDSGQHVRFPFHLKLKMLQIFKHISRIDFLAYQKFHLVQGREYETKGRFSSFAMYAKLVPHIRNSVEQAT